MRVYFYCLPTPQTGIVPFQHLLVCLAEGLQALGIACYSSVDYWPLDATGTRFLLHHDRNVSPDDCDLVIVSDDWFTWGEREIPEGLFHPRRSYRTIALDRQDGTRLVTFRPEFRHFDLILRTHYNEATRYPSNFRPWAYGISERIIQATSGGAIEAQRHKVLLANWRHTSNPHSVRLAVERAFLPRAAAVLEVDTGHEKLDAPPEGSYERVLWYETGKRHWPEYYQRLRGASACACFGGFFISRFPRNKEGAMSRAFRQGLSRLRLHSTLVSQFDSWRLWESFAAGCCTVHLDFQRYGCIFPEQPRNGIHYLGIDLQRIDSGIDVLADANARARIAQAGRQWALEHYSPRATATRVLSLLS